jgi:hypothetical protein
MPDLLREPTTLQQSLSWARKKRLITDRYQNGTLSLAALGYIARPGLPQGINADAGEEFSPGCQSGSAGVTLFLVE